VAAFDIEVRNRGRQVVRVAEDRFLLHALEDAGMRLPFGCRFGACLSCAASLVEGRVDHSHGRAFALREHDEREGYVLLCVSQPRSDCVIDVGVRRELYHNPFRERRPVHCRYERDTDDGGRDGRPSAQQGQGTVQGRVRAGIRQW
jgi:ferredoxin